MKKKPTKNKQHDSAYFSLIGQKGGKVMAERGSDYFAAIAKLSHPRDHYFGGRPKGSKTKKKG